MGASTVSSGWSNHFIELLNIFHIKMPLWLAYDHWTGLHTAETAIARQIASADGSLVPGTQAFLERVAAIVAAQSPELVQRAHELLSAPTIFGVEIGFNLPAFLIALVITAILTIGIKESAQLQCHHRGRQGRGGALRHRPGHDVCFNQATGAMSWSTFAPMGFSGIGAGAAYIFFAYIGFDAVSTTAQEAKNPQRDLPIGIIASLLICTVLYIAVAAVLTGMVPWQDVNIEAPIARAFLDRGLDWRLPHHYAGSAGRPYQRNAGHAARPDPRALLHGERWTAAQQVFRRHPSQVPHALEEHDPGGLLAAVVGSITPIDDIGKMVNIGTLLAFVIVCIAVVILRRTDPGQARPFRTPWVPLVPILGVIFNGYMMYKLGWVNWARLIIWLAIGLVVYFSYGRHHSRVQAAYGKKKI